MRYWIMLFALATTALAREPKLQKFGTLYQPGDGKLPPALAESPSRRDPWTLAEKTPVKDMVIFASEKGGALWLGSPEGAARFDPKSKHPWDRWQYFNGRRWLPDNDVKNILVQEEASGGRKVWVRTATGVSLIEWKPMTLAEKAALFEDRVERRHNRHGLVASSILNKPGDLQSNEPFSTDNDGLWTAIYLGAEAYRFRVTGNIEARQRARRSLDALIRLEEITGIKGFPARSYISVREQKPGDGEWHSTADGQWLWKGDTSSDESVGHFYGYALYYDLVASEPEKQMIRPIVARLMDHLIEHDYNLVDLDGKPTRWGEWSESFYKTEEGKYEAALRSIELMSFLATSYHITGDRKYLAAKKDRVQRGYADLMKDYRRWPGGGEINFSDDELAYLSYQPLLMYEKDPTIRKPALDSLRFTWGEIRSDFNPLWNYISAAVGAKRMDLATREESRRTLERIPTSTVEWGLRNSHRQDIEFRHDKDRFGRVELTRTLAPDERAVHKWNSNPYRADGGGGGNAEDDGAFFLLPYWMGRSHGWISQKD